MILQCPSCDARFLISDALIPEGGREVRCGKCKNTWHASHNPVPLDLPEAQPAAPVFANFQDALASATADEADFMAASVVRDTRLPAVHAPVFKIRSFVWSSAVMAILVMILAPIAFYPQWKDGPLAGLYNAIGWYPSDGLNFDDVTFERTKLDASKTHYSIKGNITNKAKYPRTIDRVRIELKDAGGDAIWSRTYPVGKELKPGDIYPFDIPEVETTFGGRVKTVMMDIGNSYEMMMR